MSRLMEESRRLIEAQRQIEMERAQLRAELRARRAKKKAEEEAKKEEIRRQEEEDKKLAKKEAKDKENAEKKRLRDQAAEELKKEDESRIAEFRKNQTGYSREFFKSLENPDDPAQRKEFLRLHNEKVAAYQRSLKAQKLKEDLEKMKNKPPGQRLQEQRKIPVETDPWSRPAEFWNQSWKAVTAASLSKGYFHCGSQSHSALCAATAKVSSQLARPALTIKPWVTSSLNLTPLWKTSPQHLMTTVGRSLTKSLTSALGAFSPLSWVSLMALPHTSSTSPLAPSSLQVTNGRWMQMARLSAWSPSCCSQLCP